MLSHLNRLLLTVGVFLCAFGTSGAGTYIDGAGATLSSASNNGQIYINIQNASLGVNLNYGYSGFINWTQNGGKSTFSSFCIELNQDVNFGSSYNFTRVALETAPKPGPPSPMGMDKANAIRALWAQNYSADMDLKHAAAFQLAIWRIEYDLGSSAPLASFTTGSFRANSNGNGQASQDSINYALSMLTNLDLDGPMANNIYGLTGSGFQDQITQVTPEPTSLCLGAIGSLALAAYGYRRRKATLQGTLKEA